MKLFESKWLKRFEGKQSPTLNKKRVGRGFIYT